MTLLNRVNCTLVFCLSMIFLFAQETQIGQGNFDGVVVNSSSNDGTGERTLMATGYLPNLSSASRFLSQASFGGSYQDIVDLSQQSFEQWIDDQMAMPRPWSLQDYVYDLHQARTDSINLTRHDTLPDLTIREVRLDDWYFDIAWFQYAMTSDDALRQRVALALSEIFVISRESDFDNNPYALTDYYDMLLDHAFANYRTLLDSITYHPAMASYLTFINNPATDTLTTKKIFPDQNYAREIMQLFSIGLFELNLDGTEKKNAQGVPIPTYDQYDIEQLSGVFTGFSWPESEYFGDRSESYWSYTEPIKYHPFKVQGRTVVYAHEPGPKNFLNVSIPDHPVYPDGGYRDINAALDGLAAHPNVGPFLAYRLIQRLIKSNPSPDYVARVATVFNDNGNGVRGDLGAVVRAILLDKEARDCQNIAMPGSGMLREPFLRYMHLLKALDLTAEGGVYRNTMSRIYDEVEQRPLHAQTVFNFFEPGFQPNGPVMENGYYAPEFQIVNAQTQVGYLNLFNDYLNDNRDVVDYKSYFDDEAFKSGERPDLDFTYLTSLADDEGEIPFLVDHLNVLLVHGNLNPTSVQILVNALEDYDEDPDDVAKMAVFLVMASPDYLINR
ncbi:MAG: DUF1800 family protein [Bacteroidota bacterium]